MNHPKGLPFDKLLKPGGDCDRPACEDTMSALSAALERVGQKSTATLLGNNSVECPPTKDTIGRSSWTLLHTMAAWYPDSPTPDEENKMKSFVDALSIFYPCSYCATDFQENIKKVPVK